MSKAISDRRMRARALRQSALALVLLACAATAVAGLYPAAAPPGSAFIRVFNASNQPKVTAQVGSKNLGDVNALEASAYAFLPPGQYPVKIGDASENTNLQGSHCYTAALGSDSKVHQFEQQCFNSQLKSLVAVYNLIDGTTLSLKTADGTAVVENVAANATGQREVNPIKADLAIYDGANKLADAKPVTLMRGSTYSLFVMGTRSSPVLIWVNG
ncbi:MULTISPECIES: alginate O-acetyltransferase AlgF [Dyella]|uniref:Alginate biosynthesis protein AlgF n=2 Tax=Dyella TaxID=231454 RepID=A0A4R0Z0R7_9GAMM|nr:MULTISPECIES: alginate O-acetyltransferase AlgF [Dyella]TBR39446.1 alginate O-acetyltransferase [Dyella terrae]TCI12968.1 alginate O-acetyltransferase [Dyella soli]